MKYLSLEQTVMARPIHLPPSHGEPTEFELWLASDQNADAVERCAHHCDRLDCEDPTTCPYCLSLEAWAAAGWPSEWPPKEPHGEDSGQAFRRPPRHA